MANSAFSDATHSANRHSDIAITSVSSNDVLKFDGSNWINSTLASAGILTVANPTFTGTLTVGSAALTEAELEMLDGITAGTAAASKAVVLDSSTNITGIGTITATTFSGALSGNATSATSAATLTSARNIGGVSFNGSAAINLPGVNAAGDQNTSGTAAGLSATLVVASGGTGLASYTAGDMFYYASGTTLTKLAKGTADQVLTMNNGATAPGWETAAAGGVSFSGSTANGMVTYGSSSSAVVESKITFGTAVAGSNSDVLKIEGDFGDYANGPLQIKTTHTSNTQGYPGISFYQNDNTLLATFRPGLTSNDGGALSIGSAGNIYFAANDADANANTFMKIATTGEVTVKENGSMPSVTLGIVKAWLQFEQTNHGTPVVSYNVDSVTDGGAAGNTDIAWDANFSSIEYAIVGITDNTRCINDVTRSAGAATIQVIRTTNGAGQDSDNVSIIVCGVRTT